MNKKVIQVLFSVMFVMLLACNTARADMYPLHALNPAICTPPTPPLPGQPGYGPANAFYNGIYYNPDSGLWMIPDGLYNGSDAERDVAIIEETIAANPPQRPDWAIFDVEQDGTYYFSGGYYNGHYYAAGYYLPNEIW